MNYNIEDYINKFVQFYPSDTYSKWGYIRRVDDLGFLYEVTKANDEDDLGIFFVAHSRGIRFKLMDIDEDEVRARYSKEEEG